MAGRQKPYRWSVNTAAAEFGVDRRWLTKRLRQDSIEPGEDGKFSTQQVASTIYGGIGAEKLGKTRAERELLEIELAKEREELIHRDRLFRFLENVFIAVKMKILGSGLSDIEKERVLNNLVSLRDADL